MWNCPLQSGVFTQPQSDPAANDAITLHWPRSCLAGRGRTHAFRQQSCDVRAAHQAAHVPPVLHTVSDKLWRRFARAAPAPMQRRQFAVVWRVAGRRSETRTGRRRDTQPLTTQPLSYPGHRVSDAIDGRITPRRDRAAVQHTVARSVYILADTLPCRGLGHQAPARPAAQRHA